MDPNSQRQSRGRRKRKSQSSTAAQSVTTIASLSDDNLAEILIRLPSPASLGRVALAFPRWLRLATSRDFLRRFRDLHPRPPLLGCFTSCYEGLPVFRRVRDFSLASFVDGHRWSVKDCRDGLFLLASDDDELALFDPVSRRRVRIPLAPRDVRGSTHSVNLLPPCVGDADDASSFRVVSLDKYGLWENGNVRAHVYSSRTGEWRSHQWAPPPRCESLHSVSFSSPMHADGRIYWKQPRLEINSMLLSLNAETMELSYVEVPPASALTTNTNGRYYSYVVGDTEDGVCCLVTVPTIHHKNHALRVWLRNEENGSWKPWSGLQSFESLFSCHDTGSKLSCRVDACAVVAGVVLLHFYEHGKCVHHRYIALRIKGKHTSPVADFEVEDKFYSGHASTAFPYLMTWPRPAL